MQFFSSFDQMVVFSKQFSLILFFLFFVGVLFWAFRPANKKRLEEASRRALEEDDRNQP